MITRQLLMEFLDEDDDAKAWGGLRDDFVDAPDCDVMADRFANWLGARGIVAGVATVQMSSPYESVLGTHYFTVVHGIAVDWTARQFYNVRGPSFAIDALHGKERYIVQDESEIPSPLLFVWPGPYPLPTLEATE